MSVAKELRNLSDCIAHNQHGAELLDALWIADGEKAEIAVRRLQNIAPHVDALLAAIAESAGLDFKRWSSILSDALEGELLFALQQKADEGREEEDDFAQHNTLNCVQQGIGR